MLKPVALRPGDPNRPVLLLLTNTTLGSWEEAGLPEQVQAWIARVWSDQVDHDCDELISSVNVIGDAYMSAHAFSVVEVARYYSDIVGPAWRSSQRMFVAIGTKPHGLAGVVCGFADPSLAIFARVPNGYLVRDVTAGPHCWRYRFRDLSSPIWAMKNYADWG